MFKVIRPNIEIAITPPRIARFRSNLVHKSDHVTASTLQMFKVKSQSHGVEGQGHSVT